MMSTRTFANAVIGPYSRPSSALSASKVPSVNEPLITETPPMPKTNAVAKDPTKTIAVKNTLFDIAILIPMIRTESAFSENISDSRFAVPKIFINKAPETLKRSAICVLIAELKSACFRVNTCNLVPIHLAGIMNNGSRRSEATVICQDRTNIVPATITKLITLPTTPPKVDVNALCAPITSPFSLEISAPVWARVKNAIDCCCT